MPLMRLALPVLLAAADQWQPWETTTPAVVVDNSIAVQVLPVTPEEFAEPGAKLSETAAEWASADSSISAERLRAAKAGRRAYEAELQAVEEQVEAAKGGDGLREKVEKVRKLRAKTMEAARMTGRLVAQIPAAVERGAQRAVEEVAAEALKKIEEEKVALAAKTPAEELTPAAPGGLELADREAKQVATVQSYSAAAQELARQSNIMKQRAMNLGHQAVQWQARKLELSDFAKAQDLQMKANDLMEKAAPMSKEAIIYQDVAQLMSKEAGAMKALEVTPEKHQA
ncbi:unnamed protein product [Durusdinium trenchii]|uniref:Uncharacterized protein n=1 Tax=Durusdinium trenchii TaxID=1381693 RepID=A0ABP0J2H0_9DINO